MLFWFATNGAWRNASTDAKSAGHALIMFRNTTGRPRAMASRAAIGVASAMTGMV